MNVTIKPTAFANQRDSRPFATEMPWNLVGNIGTDDSKGGFQYLEEKGMGAPRRFLVVVFFWGGCLEDLGGSLQLVSA